MEFRDQEHEENYYMLIARANMNATDVYRKALFFILAGNEYLLEKVAAIYDFDENGIKPNCLRSLRLSGGTKALLKLALHLYNVHHKITVEDAFCSLDAENKQLALEAIRIRYIL